MKVWKNGGLKFRMFSSIFKEEIAMKKMFKRAVSLVCVSSMLLTVGCSNSSSSKSEEPKESIDSALTEELFGELTPLDEKTDLTIALSAGATSGFMLWLAEELGAYDKAGINADFVTFANGVVMMEAAASNSWDIGQYGLGGTHTGTISHDVISFAAGARDNHSLMIFAPKDSPIVQAGKTTATAENLYGTKELWEGQDIFLPVGSTLHYALTIGLEHFGLSGSDVKLTHMEVPNINTALRAGQCDLGGVYGNYSYGDLNDNFVPVLQAEDVGCELYTAIGATDKSYNDPQKQLAIKKTLEIYFILSDWLNDEANIDKASDWFVQWNDREGLKTSKDEIVRHLTYNMSYTLEENYELFNTVGETGVSLMLEYNLEPLKFYVEQGQRTADDLEKFSNPKYTDPKLVEELYNEMK